MPEKSEFALSVMRYELTPVFIEGLKLKLGEPWVTETLVAASVGKFKPKPAAPPEAKTLKPDGIKTICWPLVTLTSRAPTVAPAVIAIGTDKEVTLVAETAPVVMPTVPLVPCGMVNSTILEAEKLVLVPVIVRVVVALP